ncbi:hypothetical protein HDU91_002780 [Kappamyces sp. JEL0680]|nr:hypothetical protein HDU91_002780 [Kappamyces sp. JEL0680]
MGVYSGPIYLDTYDYVAVSAAFMVSLIGCIAILVVLAAISRYPISGSGLLILSLCASDFLNLSGSGYFYIKHLIYGYWPESPSDCLINYMSAMVSAGASCLTLGAIAFDRNLHISWSISLSKSMIVWTMIVPTWSFAIFFTISPLLFGNLETLTESIQLELSKTVCTIVWGAPTTPSRLIFGGTVFVVLLGQFLISNSYMSIYMTFRRVKRSRRNISDGEQVVLKKCIALTISFFLFFSPEVWRAD